MNPPISSPVSDRPWLLPSWPAPDSVRAISTLRSGGQVGVSQPPFDRFNLGAACGDEFAAVTHNRAMLGELAGLPSAPCWLRQVHGQRVCRFAAAIDPNADAIEADAAVAATPSVVLAILTADCLPVLFCAEDGSEVAAAHAGWRGLAVGVLERTVAAMHCPPGRLLAWLGPAAGPQAYEVGEEVRSAFVEGDPSAARAFVSTRPGHFLCDLPQLARLRLERLGVRSISGGELCTISDPQRFFSHRRDGRSGRMASLIWIAPRPGNRAHPT